MRREKRKSRVGTSLSGEPFDDVEHAWFWFMQARRARPDGAGLNAGAGSVPRLCEPIDIYRQLDNLYRARRVLREWRRPFWAST